MIDKKTFLSNPIVFENNANILKALAHPIRLCIVKGLIETGGCNVTNIQLCLNIPQSTISQHVAKLKSCGIIVGERNGLEIFYKVANKKVEELIKVLFD